MLTVRSDKNFTILLSKLRRLAQPVGQDDDDQLRQDADDQPRQVADDQFRQVADDLFRQDTHSPSGNNIQDGFFQFPVCNPLLPIPRHQVEGTCSF